MELDPPLPPETGADPEIEGYVTDIPDLSVPRMDRKRQGSN